MRYLLRMIFNLAIDQDDDGNAAGGRAKPERPPTIVPPPKHALKQDGIAERAMTARYQQAVRSTGPSKPFLASQAGKFDERNPPPHDVVPDGPGEAARALNRRLHPMNDELPGDLGRPKVDTSERDGLPAFPDPREADPRAKPYLEPSSPHLVDAGANS